MKRLFTCLLPLTLVVPAWADFIAVGFDGGRVARVNETTGAIQIIGFTSSDAALTASLMRDPLTNTFYTVGGLESGGVRRLFTLDPNTGQTTLVAPLSQNLSIQALAVAPTGGLLYATSNSDSTLYTINPGTGQVSAVGSMGVGLGYTYSLAFAPDGTLYGYSNIGGELNHGGPGFFRIDPVTAAITILTPTGLNPVLGVEDIAFAPDGTLWAGGGSAFEPLNLQTGLAAGPAHLISFDIRGMAFLPATAVPEPASYFLLGAGLLSVAALRRFRR
jgi:DNA-binding beta-propeller fold protein YncE